MDHENVVKKLSESKAEGKRRMGRLRLRWLEEALNLREMNVK
jgi:hypothetical protein